MRAFKVCVSLGILSLSTWADAAGKEGMACRRVHAEIDLSLGTIRGNLGLNGTAVFTRDGQGTAPVTAQPGSSVFSGVLAIVTEGGELTMRETGVFSARSGNPDGAVLVSWADSLVGTGVFEGAAGNLFFTGRTSEAGLQVTVTGQVCRP